MAGGSQNGISNNPAGRPIGGRNKKNELWDKLGEYITNGAATKLQRELQALSGKEYIDALSKVLKYFKPTLQATKIEADVTGINQINLVVSEDTANALLDE